MITSNCVGGTEVVEVYQFLHRGAMATVQVRVPRYGPPADIPSGSCAGGLAERPAPVRIQLTKSGRCRKAAGCWPMTCSGRRGATAKWRGRGAGVGAIGRGGGDGLQFHVAELQNYAVGGCGILVHNTNDPSNEIPPLMELPGGQLRALLRLQLFRGSEGTRNQSQSTTVQPDNQSTGLNPNNPSVVFVGHQAIVAPHLRAGPMLPWSLMETSMWLECMQSLGKWQGGEATIHSMGLPKSMQRAES